jgi:membrane fusion protein (multidrug efflux system)
MRKSNLFVLAVLVAAAAALQACSEKKEPPPPPPPPLVKVATVLQRDVPIMLEAIGQTRGSTEIEVRARVGGYIQTVTFTEGMPVRKGQLLYTIDPSLFEAALAQSKGALAGTEADLARAKQDVERYRPLAAENAIPKETYDTAVSLQRAAEAAVDAAKAAVQRAQIDLGYTKVYAPEAGLIGKTEVYPGTLVGQGQTNLLTHISQIASIHVRFTLPEKDYLRLARRRIENGVTTETPKAPLELVLADGAVHPQPGKMVFVDRNVDPETGTILMEAAFPNPTGVVRPGQYARVRAAIETKAGAILVPQRAVTELQGIYNVAVVGADSAVEVRMVTPGQRVGSLWLIESGLKPGDKVVVEGTQKVRPGLKVTPEVVTIKDDGATPAPGATPVANAAGIQGKQG